MEKINKKLALQAIQVPEFREFLLYRIKLTGEQLAKLTTCPGCWDNFKTPGAIKIINKKLEALVIEGKIKQYASFAKIRCVKSKKKAHEYIDSLSEFETIYLGAKEKN